MWREQEQTEVCIDGVEYPIHGTIYRCDNCGNKILVKDMYMEEDE
jgi:DNA-directed RNA polymerase subunit RPC12/RpoP